MRTLPALLIAVVTLALSGCGNGSNLDEASRSGTEPPPIRVADERGYVEYSEPTQNEVPEPVEGKADEPSTPVLVKKCKVVDFDLEVKPQKVKKELITWVKQEVEFDRTEEVDSRMMEAEHLHLIGTVLEVESGSPLSFVDWLLIYVVPRSGERADVAWGAEFSSRREELKVDGSRDLRGFLTDTGEISLEGLVYARSPDEDTMLGATLTFRSFYDCVWE